VTAVVAVAFENHALAESITFSVTVAPAAQPYTETYVLDGFDPSLGTLDDVRIHADDTVTASGSITNSTSQDAGPSHLRIEGFMKAIFTNSAGFSAGTPPLDALQTFQIPAISSNTTYTIDPALSTFDLNDELLTPGNFVDMVQTFEGGPLNATLNAFGSLTLPPDMDSAVTMSIGGDFSVTYDYTPAPESSTLLMVAIGLAGLMGIAHKKRYKLQKS